ncbi:MAG TPA: M2 family metallopeptidase [Woeseiaceae bacterium]|nr:M2 family metallopeptidase [Woeseiaceae bacterium]
MKNLPALVFLFLGLGFSACSNDALDKNHDSTNDTAASSTETAEEFVARANSELAEQLLEGNAAGWVFSTYITTDTSLLSAKANERYAAWFSGIVKQAAAYDGEELQPATRRAIDLLKLGTSQPAPDNAAKRRELSQIAARLEGDYGAGKYCKEAGDCKTLPELEDVLAESRDYDELLDAWAGWRTVSPPMRKPYERFVELLNEGAAELGYDDLGEMWRSGYDMSPAEFEADTARLWQQVKPLYDELHCHVRARLGEQYGTDKVPQDGPIPAHLLGNMWSQGWSFIYDIMEPYPSVAPLDVDKTLQAKNYTPKEMVRSAENFYVSLGMPQLPETFWERSMFSKPPDRDVVCHASAWNMDGADDVRIKMCIKQTYDELRTIYHELGHNYYQRAYRDQPPIFRDGANGGFHEAIGDTITLSMTPGYLAQVGLIESDAESREAVINRQMMQALDKLAFLPFGKLIDEWRWGVFSGAIAPADYNKSWWELRTKYQGIAAPLPRSESDFDPGAKYHIAANVSYTRYFVAHILQFQFQRALCKAAGFDGELQACSIFQSKEAGTRLQAMLEAGASKPWQDTLETLTGTREMDASAIIDYFQPLMGYLKEQNEGRSCGW